MSANERKPRLAPLVAKLKASSSHNGKLIQDRASETWDILRKDSFRQMGSPSRAVIAAICVITPRELKLLTLEEEKQFAELANVALQRYEQLINPPNKVGNLIAGILKEIS